MSSLVRWDPFAELSALQKQFFGDDVASAFKGINIPTTDVYTKDNEMVIEAHLPNFNHDDVNIEIENRSIVISAERHEKQEDKNKKYVVRESSSSFYRRIQLPERADTDNINASLDEGVLRVKIPLTPLPEPKRVAITSGKNSKK